MKGKLWKCFLGWLEDSKDCIVAIALGSEIRFSEAFFREIVLNILPIPCLFSPFPLTFPLPSPLLFPIPPFHMNQYPEWWNVCKCCLNDLFIFLQLKTELFYNLSPSPSLSKFILTVIFPNFFPSSQEHLFFSVHIYFSKCIIQ